jgi:hypothetical protein
MFEERKMRIFVPFPLRVPSSRAVRRPRPVQWKIASKRGLLRRFRHFIESAGERIPRGMPRGRRAKTKGRVPFKDQSFSAACWGGLQSAGGVERCFCNKWVDEACIGVIVVSVLYFSPVLIPLFLE